MVRDVCKALGNEERARLLVCLSKPQCVNDLLDRCTLSQSALSQHLKILRECGLVTCTKEGRWKVYRARSKQAVRVAQALLALAR